VTCLLARSVAGWRGKWVLWFCGRLGYNSFLEGSSASASTRLFFLDVL